MPTWRDALRDRNTARVPRLWWLVVGLTALALWVLGFPGTAVSYDTEFAVVALVVTVQAVALPLALARPLTASVVQLAAALAMSVDTDPIRDPTWPYSVVTMVALAVNQGILGLRRNWTVALAVWWVGVLLGICIVLADPGPDSLRNAQVPLIVHTVVSALVLAVTVVWQQRGEVRRELAEARLDVRLEQNRRAVVQERARIARELHDVVAHSMSVIHMQASSAPFRLKGLDEEAKGEFSDIAASARRATAEMRQLLGVLRDETADVQRAPAPGLADLPLLVSSVEGAGVSVHLGTLDFNVPPTVDVVAYRIVQEALSNVVRHAPGSSATVELRVRSGTLLIGVTNSAVPPHTPAVEGPGERAGHGLRGMAERAELLGGSVDHGPTEDGGFQVRAKLPLRGHEEVSR